MAGANDPGVQSVRADLQPLQAFRHCHRGDGRELSQRGADHGAGGCDLLTIAPELLAQLASTEAPLQRALDAEAAGMEMDLPTP
jgi:transaldolase